MAAIAAAIGGVVTVRGVGVLGETDQDQRSLREFVRLDSAGRLPWVGGLDDPAWI